MAVEGRRPRRSAWRGRSEIKEVAAMTLVEGIYPSEIRRKTMSRRELSISTSREKLERDRVELHHASSRRKSRLEWMALWTLRFVWISYDGVWG